MEKLSHVHQRKSSKQAKSKKKPIKVVYISNPMKVKTSASEFRALVQELTGQDSNLADAAKFMENDSVDVSQLVPDQGMKLADGDHVPEVPKMDPYRESPKSFGSSIESFDDMFNFQMIDQNFAGFLPSSLVYDSPQ